MAMDTFAVEAFILLSLGISIILFRTYARIHLAGLSQLEADDYLMLLVLVPYTAETVLAYLVGEKANGLTNSGMTDAERFDLDSSSEEYQWRVTGSKIQVAGWCMYVSVLWIIKAALCAFYVRLTSGLNGYNTRLTVGFASIVITYIALIASILFACHPMQHNWQIYPNPGNLCQPALSKVNIFLTVTLNVATDLYLVFIPIPMLWGAQLPRIKKIGLIVLFSGAIFVMVAGILRCVLILQNPVTGPRQGSSWAVRESFVAVATSSLPMIWAVLRRWLKPVFGSLLSSNKRTTGPEPGSIMLADRAHPSSGPASDWSRQHNSTSVAADAASNNSKQFTVFNDNSSEQLHGKV